MKILAHWRILLSLLAIILVSGLAGGLLGHRAARRQLEQRNDPEHWNERVARVFDRIVKPTPDQAGRIQAHLDRAVRELQTIRLDTLSRSTNVIWRLVEEVEWELTPDQQKAFEAIKPKPGDLTLDVLDVTPPAGEPPRP